MSFFVAARPSRAVAELMVRLQWTQEGEVELVVDNKKFVMKLRQLCPDIDRLGIWPVVVGKGRRY